MTSVATTPTAAPIDREQTCPLLLRVFVNEVSFSIQLVGSILGYHISGFVRVLEQRECAPHSDSVGNSENSVFPSPYLIPCYPILLPVTFTLCYPLFPLSFPLLLCYPLLPSLSPLLPLLPSLPLCYPLLPSLPLITPCYPLSPPYYPLLPLLPPAPSVTLTRLLQGQHHLPDAYHRGRVPATELQIYTWKDACLKELTNLIKDVHPQASSKGNYQQFR